MSTMNYYVVLGIAQDADSDAIRRAFRALARRYHPDAGAGSSTDEFRRALEAAPLDLYDLHVRSLALGDEAHHRMDALDRKTLPRLRSVWPATMDPRAPPEPA